MALHLPVRALACSNGGYSTLALPMCHPWMWARIKSPNQLGNQFQFHLFINQSQLPLYKINNITANYLQYTYHTKQKQIKLKEDGGKELYIIVFKTN